MNWTTRHWLLIAGLLGAIALQLAGIQHWNEATSPAFVAGLLVQIATVLRAIYTGKPGDTA